ncbi:hypothetical protein TSUD_200250 [Trifolium subterraneum]|nr:hypothetical protein TSUD_200250 [Trifolium subterraneum]
MDHFHTLLLVFFLLVSHSTSEFVGSSCLRVPPNKFVDSAKQVTTILQQLRSNLSPFMSNTSGDGISVCLDLLDMSSEQLRMSMSAVQNPKEKDRLGTGNLSSDLRTWLSAVLTNSDTCIEGLEEGTAVKGIASKELNRVMAAPDFSMKRYVIYVKQGVYRDEYVRINATKWNIMLLGDGIGVTVISGSRNYIDGYKTFNTATFAVDAVGFIACNISFQNTAGPEKAMASYLSSVVDPKGWLEMEGNASLATLTYGEYNNFGPGAKVDNRVKWSGYHLLSESEAQEFTVDKFIEGDLWLPSNGINYTAGL